MFMKELTLETTIENVDKVIEFINKELDVFGCINKTKMEVNVAADEIFANIVNYAYKNKVGKATIKIELKDNPKAIVITFIDNGTPFNPLEKEVQKLEEPNKPTRPNEQKSIIKKIYEETQNKEKEALKKNRRVQINLDNNKYFHYKIDSALFDCYEVYNKNEDLIKFGKENDIMDLEQYMKILKDKKNLKPAIKKYHKDSIKIDKDYKYAENLSERDIIPDLYEEE